MRKNTKTLVHKPSQENLWPPWPTILAGETELEKALREQEERKAANRSAEIDRDIEHSRLDTQKQKDQIRMLLLGEPLRLKSCFHVHSVARSTGKREVNDTQELPAPVCSQSLQAGVSSLARSHSSQSCLLGELHRRPDCGPNSQQISFDGFRPVCNRTGHRTQAD